MITQLLMFTSIAMAAAPQIQTQNYFRATLGPGNPEIILITETLVDKEKAYFVSYTFDGRLMRKIAVDKTMRDQLIGDFGQAISGARQKKLGELTAGCGQPLNLKVRDNGTLSEQDLCLDIATTRERDAITKWWRQIRSLLRI